MKQRTKTGIQAVILTALLIGLPLLGAWLDGKSLAQYWEFPPLTQYTPHAPFSWPVFLAMAAGILLVILPFDAWVILTRRTRKHTGWTASGATPTPPHSHTPIPLWAWAGLALTLVAWFLAWTRFSWFEPFQTFTFSPIWFGYILFINGLSYRRTGHCLLMDRPGYLFKLFIASAVFWWFFEYLNRFVQNWYYVGIDGISPSQYILFATLPFSTVLPAVMSTHDLLTSYPSAGAGLDTFVRINIVRKKQVAGFMLAFSSLGLAGIAIWPNALYPLLWLAPLFIITSLQTLFGETTLFDPIRLGNWRRLYLLACAALICGFFWEMWNAHSVAKWIYTVPYVTRFRIFEMPFLGFAGYLPFGLECAVIADWLLGRDCCVLREGPVLK